MQLSNVLAMIIFGELFAQYYAIEDLRLHIWQKFLVTVLAIGLLKYQDVWVRKELGTSNRRSIIVTYTVLDKQRLYASYLLRIELVVDKNVFSPQPYFI